VDIFEKIKQNPGPLGKYSRDGHGYFFFPKLEGPISNRMSFRGKEMLVWSINNYLGFANHAELRQIDIQAVQEHGLSAPMGARMITGQTAAHEKTERALAKFVGKQAAYLLNFAYQGCVSIVDALVDRNDVIVYDADCHACMLDGFRLHLGKRFVYQHNDIDSLRKQLERAKQMTEQTGGGILVATEGVFGMAGDQGKLKEIIDLKQEFDFRLFVDDAHGFGVLGETGAGTPEHQGVQAGVDVYFASFDKAFASSGAFVAADEEIIEYLEYNMRSQIFGQSLPVAFVLGIAKRLELLKNKELKDSLWQVATALQEGLKQEGFDIGITNTHITPVLLKGTLPEATNVTFDLRENYNIFCSIVIYPVVPKDVIMLRLMPTALHTLEDVQYTIDILKKVREKLENKEYSSTEYASWS
jgi:glycine C-acetyltransferase